MPRKIASTTPALSISESPTVSPIVPEAPVPPAVPKPAVVRTWAFASTVLGLGLAFGLLQSYFFYGEKLGISYPIFIMLAVAAIAYLGISQNLRITKREYLWFVPIFFFSIMAAVRSAELLTFVNVSVSFYCLMAFVWMRTPIDGERLFQFRRILLLPLAYMSNWFSTAKSFRAAGSVKPVTPKSARADKIASILKGCMMSIPLVGIFVALFASGDLVFRGALETLSSWIGVWHFPPLPDISFRRI